MPPTVTPLALGQLSLWLLLRSSFCCCSSSLCSCTSCCCRCRGVRQGLCHSGREAAANQLWQGICLHRSAPCSQGCNGCCQLVGRAPAEARRSSNHDRIRAGVPAGFPHFTSAGIPRSAWAVAPWPKWCPTCHAQPLQHSVHKNSPCACSPLLLVQASLQVICQLRQQFTKCDHLQHVLQGQQQWYLIRETGQVALTLLRGFSISIQLDLMTISPCSLMHCTRLLGVDAQSRS